MAGYRIKKTRFIPGDDSKPLKGIYNGYNEETKKRESWADFIARHGFGENEKGPSGFSIEIDVEPIPGMRQ